MILQFGSTNAGAQVWVEPIDGGSVIAQDAEGNPIQNAGGAQLTLDAQGQLVFAFQAPTAMGRFQVIMRLDNVSTVLPFVVPDPMQDN